MPGPCGRKWASYQAPLAGIGTYRAIHQPFDTRDTAPAVAAPE